MSLYTRAKRTIPKRYGPIGDLFPCNVLLRLEFSPMDAFGAGDSPITTSQVGKPVRFLWDANDGTVSIDEGTIIERVSLTHAFPDLMGMSISFDGNVASTSFHARQVNDLAGVVSILNHYIPPLLSLYCGVPVAVKRFLGTIGNREVILEVPRMTFSLNVSSKSIMEERIAKALDGLPTLVRPEMGRLVSALYYHQQALTLDPPGSDNQRWFSEIVLNLYKAIEALWGESRAQWRLQARHLGLSDRSAEVLSSISVLRSQLDVAHVALQPLSHDERDVLDRFLGTAMREVRGLLDRLVEDSAKGKYVPPAPPKGMSGRDRVFEHIRLIEKGRQQNQ